MRWYETILVCSGFAGMFAVMLVGSALNMEANYATQQHLIDAGFNIKKTLKNHWYDWTVREFKYSSEHILVANVKDFIQIAKEHNITTINKEYTKYHFLFWFQTYDEIEGQVKIVLLG